ncbi:hypothetical protein M427DRAFT_288692 [Gonapodya prolifera JEL478]|uniref:Uncharacterized protein n=1 Tax=Gonapodya prolifera (strain JEL478) TaxID=1344416 RepID=A0A139AJR2_GONPJ|nr:hypothetical protein M427DRAFT_288692 [Gonapodya prolifera JEL478]|eukprot:KXS16635.1 hypothetical protein M427DRAFT_288692 [Gonapodya prolifera JEL478]
MTVAVTDSHVRRSRDLSVLGASELLAMMESRDPELTKPWIAARDVPRNHPLYAKLVKNGLPVSSPPAYNPDPEPDGPAAGSLPVPKEYGHTPKSHVGPPGQHRWQGSRETLFA